MTTAAAAGTTPVYCVYIEATPEAIWEAITKPEWTERYGDGGRGEYELRPGGAYRGMTSEAMRATGAPEVVIDGEVLEAASAPPARSRRASSCSAARQSGRLHPRRTVVVVEHAHGGCVQIVELAGSRRPDVRGHGHEHHEQRQGQDDEDDAHAAASMGAAGDSRCAGTPGTGASNVRPSQLPSTTVRELAGIMIAAMSGLITPVIARAAPSRL